MGIYQETVFMVFGNPIIVWVRKKFNFTEVLIGWEWCDIQEGLQCSRRKKKAGHADPPFLTNYVTDKLERELESVPYCPCIVRAHIARCYDLVEVPCKEIAALNIIG